MRDAALCAAHRTRAGPEDACGGGGGGWLDRRRDAVATFGAQGKEGAAFL